MEDHRNKPNVSLGCNLDFCEDHGVRVQVTKQRTVGKCNTCVNEYMEYLEQHRASIRLSNIIPFADKTRRVHKEKLRIPYFDYLFRIFFVLILLFGLGAVIVKAANMPSSSNIERSTTSSVVSLKATVPNTNEKKYWAETI
jgi:hypothetical protein